MLPTLAQLSSRHHGPFEEPICRAVLSACEPLERRMMLCALHGFAADDVVELRPDLVGVEYGEGPEGGPANIIWVNRGAANDGFAATFGAGAAAARTVIDNVIIAFAEMIGSFNYSDGSTNYNLTVNMDGGNSNGANASLNSTLGGKPKSGTVRMGRGPDGAGGNFFIDPTPAEHSEFRGTIQHAFAGDAQGGSPAAGLFDFYTLASAEITHCLGLFGGTGEVPDWDDLTTNTGIADTAEGNGTSTFWVFDGPSIKHLMTGFNSGSPSSFPGAVHSAGPGVTVNFGGFAYEGTDDIGNARYESGRRYLVNNVFALMFQDAYAYATANPDQFATMYANLNTTSGNLLVRGGAGTSADNITISSAGGIITVQVDLGDDVPGTGALAGAGPLPPFVTEFSAAAVSSITVQSGGGADNIRILSLPSGTPVTVSGGDGDDDIILANGDIDTNLGSNVTVTGDAGTDDVIFNDTGDAAGGDDYTLSTTSLVKNALNINRIITFGTVESLAVNGSPQDDVVNLNSLALNRTLVFNGNGGNDDFKIVGDYEININGPVTLNGDLGNDTLVIDDIIDTLADIYSLTSTTFGKNTELAGIVTYNSLSDLIIHGNNANGTFDIDSISAGTLTTVYGEDGNDIFNIGAGDFDTNIDNNITIYGGGGIDRVVIIDAADTLNDTYEINALSFTKSSSTRSVNWGSVFPPAVPDIEAFVLHASNANNTINLNGLGGSFVPPFPDPPQIYPVNATLNGGGGNDNIVIAASADVLSSLRGNISVEGQIGGGDHLRVSDFADTGADTFALSASGLTNSDWGYALSFGTLDSMLLDANGSANTVNVTGTFDGDVAINGNGGADTCNVEANFAGRYITLDGGPGLDNVNVNTDAAGWAGVRLTSNQDLASLHIFGEGNVLASSPGDMVLLVQSLAIDGTGKLDLTDEDMIIDYAAVSPIATIQGYLTSGYNAGAWSGSGINSSTAAAAGNTALGYGESSEIFTVFPAVFSGLAVDATAVLVKYTFYGDADLNGNVNLNDFNRLVGNFGASPRRWVQANFDFDDNVDLNDFNKLAANFGASGLRPQERGAPWPDPLWDELFGSQRRDFSLST